jgi:hypothetical protein
MRSVVFWGFVIDRNTCARTTRLLPPRHGMRTNNATTRSSSTRFRFRVDLLGRLCTLRRLLILSRFTNGVGSTEIDGRVQQMRSNIDYVRSVHVPVTVRLSYSIAWVCPASTYLYFSLSLSLSRSRASPLPVATTRELVRSVLREFLSSSIFISHTNNDCQPMTRVDAIAVDVGANGRQRANAISPDAREARHHRPAQAIGNIA